MSQINSCASAVAPLNESAKVQVHKFGGSSLATADCVKRVAGIILRKARVGDVVVVSANGNSTDRLIALAESECAKTQLAILSELESFQQTLIHNLVNESTAEPLISKLTDDICRVQAWIFAAQESQSNLLPLYNQVLAYGEVWSARILSAYLSTQATASEMLDARSFLQASLTGHDVKVDFASSKTSLSAQYNAQQITVITGFIATDSAGETLLLGRNGSDYSATIIANLLGAKSATIWTDVTGIYSADPRIVNNAQKFTQLPQTVACELGRLGNPVLHEKTISPLFNTQTELTIASSFEAEIKGTAVVEQGQLAVDEKALSVTYLNGLTHISSPAYNQVSAANIDKALSPILSDPLNHSLVVTQADAEHAKTLFAAQPFNAIYTQVSLLAVVGENVADEEQVRERLLKAVPTEQIFEQYDTHSAHSCAVLVNQPIGVDIVNHAHDLLLDTPKPVGLVVAGLGNIGKTFIELLNNQLNSRDELSNTLLIGALSSKQAWFDKQGLNPKTLVNNFSDSATTYQQAEFLQWLIDTKHSGAFSEVVVIDITPSNAFASLYGSFFAEGIHLVGANKCAGSDSLSTYRELKRLCASNNAHWLASTTVGAGLPINATIDELASAGDAINEISGIFSGTLSWLFQNFDGSEAFSSLVLKARAQGLTEPDPRDDLSGLDVQRKLLILARDAGFELELDDISVENLVPESLQTLSLEEFLVQIEQMDAEFSKRLDEAQKEQKTLRYVARFSKVESGWQAAVALEALPIDSAFANLTPCDNVFMLTTTWYQQNPLIIRGPGAGREVTAGGLHADLIKLSRLLQQRVLD